MAVANKFATLVHRNTNNVTLILVYALLEWVLIILLLLNSLFSYLIVEFANYFGLKPPCPWCSRIDHFINPKKGKDFYRDLLCESHAAEVDHLGCKDGGEDRSNGNVVPQQHLEFFLGQDGFRLIPIELIDTTSEEHKVKCENREKDLDFDFDDESTKLVLLETMEMKEEEEENENENSIVFEYSKNYELEREIVISDHQEAMAETEQKHPEASSEKEDQEEDEESLHMPLNENEADVSIGTEIPDLELTDEILPSVTVLDDDQSELETIELKPISVELTERHLFPIDEEASDHVFELTERGTDTNVNEIEEEKVPDTPTSLDNFHLLQKKLLLLEKRESGTDESLDGSVVSEPDGVDGTSSVEKLKAALRAERKTLQALYTELEEERSASAVAANQTMAMINRLQEEKAAMQMEALQYQRMMEEQSEYDQEALQLLNELMVKREREKQELERALEVYRKRVMEYEAKEKRRSMRSESSCGSSIHAGESDGLSLDLDRENENHNNTPVEEVLNLEETLANFEDERVLILEQLKVLEEKLFSLDDEENGYHLNGNGDIEVQEMNGRLMGAKGKKLLPLFDAIDVENGDDDDDEEMHENGDGLKMIELEKNKIAIEEEVDHLYDRLQALEADREFLKHCISSLKKGDKGMDLLQEILQHLRDLREVEFRAKNINDSPPL